MMDCVAQHQLAPIECVGRHAADEREHDDRHDAHQADHAEREGAAVVRHQQRHVPQDRRRLHVAAGERNEEADPEKAEVSMLEGLEHLWVMLSANRRWAMGDR